MSNKEILKGFLATTGSPSVTDLSIMVGVCRGTMYNIIDENFVLTKERRDKINSILKNYNYAKRIN